jgi:hypothetical protein
MLKRGLTDDDARWQFLRLLARQVPGKSAQECERCLKYVEAKRVAYFGAPSRSASSSPQRSSRSPVRGPSRTSSAASAEPPPPPLPPLRTGSAAGRVH